MLDRYILAEKELTAKIKVEISTSTKYIDGILKPSSIRLFINDKETLCFTLETWDENNRADVFKACELLEAFGFDSKLAGQITYNQIPMDILRAVEY